MVKDSLALGVIPRMPSGARREATTAAANNMDSLMPRGGSGYRVSKLILTRVQAVVVDFHRRGRAYRGKIFAAKQKISKLKHDRGAYKERYLDC